MQSLLKQAPDPQCKRGLPGGYAVVVQTFRNGLQQGQRQIMALVHQT